VERLFRRLAAAEAALLEGAKAGAERLRLGLAPAAALLEQPDPRFEGAELRGRCGSLFRGELALARVELRGPLGERVAAGRELRVRARERLLGLAQLGELGLDRCELGRGRL
jgi:hypothetical protein